MINLPIEIGDTILAGRFKNKKITVKEIGVDEHGLPTINGRGILKIRIQKLMKPNKLREVQSPIKVKIKQKDKKFNLHLCSVDGDDEILNKSPFETKDLAAHYALTKGFEVQDYEQPTNLKESLKLIIKDIISEINLKKKLSEVDVTDPEIQKAIDDVAALQEQLDNAEAKVSALKKELGISQLEKSIQKIMDEKLAGLLAELKATDERIARTERIVVTVQTHGYEKEVPKYKESFLKAVEKVNAATKKVLNDIFNATKETSVVAAKLKFAKRTESLIKEENIFQKLANWVVRQLDALAPKLADQGEKIDNALDKLEQALKIN